MKKKAAVVSLFVLALSLSATTSFADAGDVGSPVAPAAAKPKKPKKVSRASTPSKKVVALPAPVESSSAAAAPAPATTMAEPVANAAPPPSSPPATSSTSSMRDEPNAPRDVDRAEYKAIALAPLVGYASEGLKLGFGARASYTFENRVSLAGTFVYHLGTSEDVVAFDGSKASASARAFYPGAEVGFDLHFDRVLVRPYAGAAALVATISTSNAGKEASDTKAHFAIYPGVAAAYEIPDTAFFAGADARLLIVTDGGNPSFGFFGMFGIRM